MPEVSLTFPDKNCPLRSIDSHLCACWSANLCACWSANRKLPL